MLGAALTIGVLGGASVAAAGTADSAVVAGAADAPYAETASSVCVAVDDTERCETLLELVDLAPTELGQLELRTFDDGSMEARVVAETNDVEAVLDAYADAGFRTTSDCSTCDGAPQLARATADGTYSAAIAADGRGVVELVIAATD